MSLAKALGGGFPIGACLATAEAAVRHDSGLAWLDLRRQSAGDRGGNAVLDVMLEPGFFDHVQKMSLLLKQKLASVVDRYPDVLARSARRGPSDRPQGRGAFGRSRQRPAREKLLTVGAGENVVRLLPPLIVTEAEIEEAVARLERACAELSQRPVEAGGGADE